MSKPGNSQVQQSTQQQNSTTNPWANAQPLLDSLISGYSGLDTGVTGGQQSALDNLTAAASGIPNFGEQGANAVGTAFDSTSTQPQIGMLKDAFSGLQSSIGKTATGGNLDPYSTPGFGDALKTMTSDITNSVKGVYNASGRDPSGAGSFAQSLGRGLTQGEAPVIQAEADRLRGEQQNAANTLYGAGNTTANAITGQQGAGIQNSSGAFSLANLLPQLFTSPATAQLNAANTAYQTPFQNLQALLNPATGLGGMGGTSSGTSSGTQTTTQNQSALSNALGIASTGIGLLSAMSDERAKENIEEVGKLHDGQPIYRYNYKGMPGGTHIGLLAQEVFETEPDAVSQFGDTGMLGVNYKRATDRAASMQRRAA